MSYQRGVIPNYEPMTGRFDERPLHSIFMDNQELRSIQPQIKRHEIRLTAAPQKILEFFFTMQEIQSAVYLRHNAEESVPFYLIRLHPEITMRFFKRKEIMNKIFKDPLKRDKYLALIEFGLFHDEIMGCLAESNYDFEIAIYKLLHIKAKRAQQVKILHQTFTDEQIGDAIEEAHDWCEVVYALMSHNPSNMVTPLSLERMDQQMSKYIVYFETHGYMKFFLCLYAFGFTPEAIIASWLVCSDWELLPYNLLTKIR